MLGPWVPRPPYHPADPLWLFVQGLAELGPFPAPGDDLSLELGLSIWLHQSGAGLEDALRGLCSSWWSWICIEAAGLDPRTEPFHWWGGHLAADLLMLASRMDDLMVRAASVAECEHRK